MNIFRKEDITLIIFVCSCMHKIKLSFFYDTKMIIQLSENQKKMLSKSF